MSPRWRVEPTWVRIGDMGLARRRAPLFIGLLAGIAVIYAALWERHPDGHVWAIVGYPIFVMVPVFALGHTYWVDVQAGLVIRRLPAGIWISRSRWDAGDGPRFSSTMQGLLTIKVGPGFGHYLYPRIMLLNDELDLTQTPATLHLMADQIQTWAPDDAHAIDPVAPLLHAQADHLAHGGTPRTSPLAARTVDTFSPVLRVASGSALLRRLFR